MCFVYTQATVCHEWETTKSLASSAVVFYMYVSSVVYSTSYNECTQETHNRHMPKKDSETALTTDVKIGNKGFYVTGIPTDPGRERGRERGRDNCFVDG